MYKELTVIDGGLTVAGTMHFEQWRDRTYTKIPAWKQWLATRLERLTLGPVMTAMFGRRIARITYNLRIREIVNHGWLVDQWDCHNIVTNEGLEYILGVGLDGTTSQITTWYLGLKDEIGDPLDGSETHTSKVFTELTTYDEANRITWVDGAITGTTTKSIDNSGTPAVFTISATDDYYGVFMASVATKGNSGAGTMFSAANFASAKSLVDNDTLTVTYTFTATDAG
jgi:hypothetical protein